MKNLIKREPLISWNLISLLVNALQLTTLPVAPWLHIIILIAAHAVTVLAARRSVSPTE